MSKWRGGRPRPPWRKLRGILLSAVLAACASAPPRMTLDQKIGQLFVETATGMFMNEQSSQYQTLLRRVREDHIGGIHWYNANVYETAWLTRKLQAAARIPMLVSADLEAGIGQRLIQTTFWPWPMAVGATGDPALAEQLGRYTAREARLLGINQVYAPLADVNNDPGNPVINVRSFGEDPHTVAQFVAAFIRGLQSEGVMATVKHFPGHGDTSVDSHRSLPILAVTRERLDAVELVPFRAAIEAGVGSVMTAHLSVPALDPATAPPRAIQRPEDHPFEATAEEIRSDATIPASLSGPITEGLLRREMGFDGLIVTDAVDMGGVTRYFDPAEAAVRAIEAGADQVLKSPNFDEALAGVKAAVRSGRLSEERIDAAVARVLRAKEKVGFAVASPEEIFREMDSPQAREVAAEIARRSITLLREEPGVLPLRRDARVITIVINDLPEKPPLDPFENELASRLNAAPPSFPVDMRTDLDELPSIIDAARQSDIVLLLFTVRFNSGKGTIDLPEAAVSLVSQLAELGKPLVGISFGTPYVLRDVPQLGTYVAAWGSQPVMQAAAGPALFGEAPITGRMPVSIPGISRIGDGIQKRISDLGSR